MAVDESADMIPADSNVNDVLTSFPFVVFIIFKSQTLIFLFYRSARAEHAVTRNFNIACSTVGKFLNSRNDLILFKLFLK